MLKYIKKLLRKAFKRFMGNCKSMIEVLKDDRSSDARELSTAISNLTKSIGRAMIMARHLDADGLRNVVFDIESKVKDINNSDYSELRLHNKDFDRCFGAMISSSEVFVNMINKYSDAISGSKFSITRHDSMPWCKHCFSHHDSVVDNLAKINTTLKKLIWSCKQTIVILKSSNAPTAVRVIKLISTIIKLAGLIMFCIGVKDMSSIDSYSKKLNVAASQLNSSAIHDNEFKRFSSVIKTLSGIVVLSIGRIVDAHVNLQAHKYGIIEVQNPFTGEPIKEGFGMKKRDYRLVKRRHCDSTAQAILFAFSLVMKLLKASVKGVFALIKNIKAYGYSKEIERKIRSGELSERVLISRCKEVAIQYLKQKLADADDIERDLIKDSISRIRSARTFEDFSFIRNEPIYGQFEMLFMAYRKAIARLEKEVDLSRTVER